MPSFMRNITITYRCAMLYRDEKLKDTGLDGCQVSYLMALYKNPGIPQEALRQSLDVNKSSVARHMAKLEETGFVERRPLEGDKRVLLCYPTKKALDMEDKIRCVLRDWRDYLTEDLTDEEKQQLQQIMEKVAAKAEKYVKRAENECEPWENT